MGEPHTPTKPDEGFSVRDPEALGDDLPTEIGRYFVVAEIGRGGMGRVYQAYDQTLERAVAIKVLRGAGRASPKVLERFRREAEVLARLTHPNVVRVFEVGVHDGSPFIVMELVDGQTLRRWLRTRPNREQIREVFAQAGRGLGAAHDEGIVHRDFKPDNVIVSADGRVRVLDFGLALLGSGAHSTVPSRGRISSPRVTQAGTVVGTPAYMSPEQHAGAELDHRSDQFSFCVVLFEALYGRAPFEGESLSEIRRTVLRARIEAPIPRDGEGRRMRRVALRGLRADPSDRWPSMDEAVMALQPRATPVRVFAVAGAIAVGVTLLAAATADAEACDAETTMRDAITEEMIGRADAAIRGTDAGYAAITADGVAAGIAEHRAAWVASFETYCETTQSQERADVGDCLRVDLSRFRARVDALARTNGESLIAAMPAIKSLPDPARCEHAELRAPRSPTPRDAELAEQVAAVRERLRGADALDSAGRIEEATVEATQALSRARRLGFGPLTAEATILLAFVTEGAGRAEDAGHLYETSFFEAAAADHAGVAFDAAHGVVRIESHFTARPDKMQRWVDVAAAWIERAPDPGNARAQHFHILSEVHSSQRRWDAAVESLTSALAEYEARGTQLQSMVRARSGLATALHDAGRFEEAVQQQRRAIEEQQRLLGDVHPFLAADHANLGGMLTTLGKHEEADESVRRGIALYEQTLGPDHPMLGNACGIHSHVLRAMNRLPEAEHAVRRAMKIHLASLPTHHPTHDHDLRSLGEIVAMQGRIDEAAQLFAQEYQLIESAGRGLSSDAGMALVNLAKVEATRGNFTLAVEKADQAEALLKEAGDADDRDWSLLYETRSDARLDLGLLDLAHDDAQRSLEAYTAAYGAESPMAADGVTMIARVLLAQRRWAEAEAAFSDAIGRIERSHGPDYPGLAELRAGRDQARARGPKRSRTVPE